MKTTTSLTIDAEVWNKAKTDIKNVSEVVESFLKSYLKIKKEPIGMDDIEQLNQALIQKRSEIDSIKDKINEIEKIKPKEIADIDKPIPEGFCTECRQEMFKTKNGWYCFKCNIGFEEKIKNGVEIKDEA